MRVVQWLRTIFERNGPEAVGISTNWLGLKACLGERKNHNFAQSCPVTLALATGQLVRSNILLVTAYHGQRTDVVSQLIYCAAASVVTAIEQQRNVSNDGLQSL
jgi:hypothetical protein